MEKLAEKYEVAGKRAFVTGTSKGLGEQIGKRLLEINAFVIGNSRSDPPESISEYIENGKADYEQGDLALRNELIVENIYKKHGGFEIFVNNAGAFSPDYITRLDADRIAREINLDLVVPLILHRNWFVKYNEHQPEAVRPELSINIGSISSFYAWPGGSAYQAAKSGLSASLAGIRSMENYLNSMSSSEDKKEVGPSADLTTRIVGIYPDNVDTGLVSRSQKDSLYRVGGDLLPPSIVADTVMKAIVGEGKFAEYDDIAILANPNEPGTHNVLKGIYLAFLPVDDETHRPDFKARVLEKIADEDMLIKSKN